MSNEFWSDISLEKIYQEARFINDEKYENHHAILYIIGRPIQDYIAANNHKLAIYKLMSKFPNLIEAIHEVVKRHFPNNLNDFHKYKILL